MSEYAKKHREAMKSKARRLASADPHQKVDASGWTPPEAMNTEAKTGLRPVSRQHRKSGGKVMGKEAAKRADKKCRKAGGRTQADEYVNRNVKKANAEFGRPHDGGYKKGGRAKKNLGGILGSVGTSLAGGLGMIALKKLLKDDDDKKPQAAPEQTPQTDSKGFPTDRNSEAARGVYPPYKKGGKVKSGNYTGGTRPTGGRIARKDGGRTKGKTNINIIIDAGGKRGAPEMPPSQMAPVRPPQSVASPPPMAPPMPPQMPLPGAGAGMAPPPMQRKSGGRVGNRRYRTFKDMDAGAGGALGRLEKTEIQGHKR